MPATPAQLESRFTSANAQEMAIKSWEVRKARIDALIKASQPLSERTIDAYSAERLMRVRKQLDRLDDLMLTEEDPQKLDRLASAQAKLAEQERLLDGRPLPGSRRPGREPQRRAPMSIEPVAPAPAPPSTPVPEPIAPTTEHLRLPGDVTP